MSKRISPVTILTTAKELIEKHGWIQNRFGDETVGFCALGARNRSNSMHGVYSIKNSLDLRLRTSRYLRAGMCAVIPPPFPGAKTTDLNDSFDTTKDAVLAAFDKAIQYARNRKIPAGVRRLMGPDV